MRTIHRNGVLTLGLIALIGSGCGGGDAERRASGMDTTQIPAAAAPAAPTTAAAPTLSDPEIAHVAVTANTIDVETGQLAESRAASPEVRDFAQTMITDHTAINEQAKALAERLGVTPEDNPMSQSLQQGAAEARSRLEGLNGAAFDRAYIDREVAFHQAVLDALDQTLVPDVQNPDLRALLQEARPIIVAHLDRARSIQSSLGAGQ